MASMCKNIRQHKVLIEKILKFKVLIPFSHFLMMHFYKNFNRRFNLVPGLAPLRNFPKIIPLFLLIFEWKDERFAVGGESQMIF
jgi:hypothetical protein